MNLSVLFFLLSRLTLLLGAGFLAALGVSRLHTEYPAEGLATQGFLASLAVTGLLYFCFHVKKQVSSRLLPKEALCAIASAWMLAVALGALPYYYGTVDLSWADAWFESASGLTTTGSSIFESVTQVAPSLLFWRALSQWLGGLGVIVFFIAVLPSLGTGAKLLYHNETSHGSSDVDYDRIQNAALLILLLYCVLSIGCFFSLLSTRMAPFHALCNTLSTVSTGGFSSGISYFSGAQQMVLIIFMVLGGVNFLSFLRLLREGFWQFRLEHETLLYGGLLMGFTTVAGMLLLLQKEGQPVRECFQSAAFHVVSFMTTTGFVQEDYNLWWPGIQALLMLAMCIGGSSGSTSGGIKVVRFATVLMACLQHVEKLFRPRLVRLVRFNQKTWEPAEQIDLMVFIILSIGMLIVGTLFLSFQEPHLPLSTLVSGVWANLFNGGPGLGVFGGPEGSYASLKEPSKYCLSLLMVMGRLELYAILILFSPSFWKE